MKVLLLGGSGQLGRDLLDALTGHDVVAPDHATLDITDEDAVRSSVTQLRPDVVINTAAFHDLVRCEHEPDRAFAVNALGPRNLARACCQTGARLVHISTDYVFSGSKGSPYTEQDMPAPLGIYGGTKRMGEHLALAGHDRTHVVRTSGLFGTNPCRGKPGGRNFVRTMLCLAVNRGEVEVVADQRCSPTYTRDLARQLVVLVDREAPPGIYHAVNGDGCSWFELARMVFAIAGLKVRVRPVTSERFGGAVPRPADSRLATRRLRQAGLLVMRPLEQALRDYLEQLHAAADYTRPCASTIVPCTSSVHV